MKSGALLENALDLDPAAAAFNDGLADGQTEPGASGAVGATAKKGIEDVREIRWPNSYPGILENQLDLPVVL